MTEPVSEEEAVMFGFLVGGAIQIWLEETERDEVPEDLARKTIEKMDEIK